MTTNNAERQAAHRAKKELFLGKISEELAKTVAENRDLRVKMAEFEKKNCIFECSTYKKGLNLRKKATISARKGS